jgi:hypothetical protein
MHEDDLFIGEMYARSLRQAGYEVDLIAKRRWLKGCWPSNTVVARHLLPGWNRNFKTAAGCQRPCAALARFSADQL